MGMPILIDVRDHEVDSAALDGAFDWLRFVDTTFSTYQDDSEISRLNRGELSLEEAHPDVRAVLGRCERLRHETGGYFDIEAAGNDPAGLVKGWSVDRAAQILEVAGARNYAIYAGGDIRVCGRPAPEPHWLVGIQHPLLPDRVAAVVPANELAIATSGAYERGRHILDPHSGRPPEGVLSVTVVGPELASADAYATAAFAMGEAGPAWTAGLGGYEAMTILDDERVLYTRSFPRVEP